MSCVQNSFGVATVVIEIFFNISDRPVVAQGHKVWLYWFDPHSRKWNIYLHLYFHFFALVFRQKRGASSATQHAMPPELGGEWETECLNTRLPMPTLLCAGYSVKLIYIFFKLVTDILLKRFVNNIYTFKYKKLNYFIYERSHLDRS